MTLNNLGRIARQGKMRPFRAPVLKKQRDGLASRIHNKFLRQQGLGGKMGKLVLRITVKAPGPAEFQGGLIVLYTGDRGNEIIGRRQSRVSPVGIDKGPVLKVRVGIAYKRTESQAADELGNVPLAALGPDYPGNAAGTRLFVLVLRIDTENLREVLNVNRAAVINRSMMKFSR